MRIRPYIEGKDYEYISKWIGSERVHALWCANLIPYPITRESFRAFLEKNALDWTDSAYVATGQDGEPVGFFCYSVNSKENEGFFKFVVVDDQKRGMGCGKEMLHLALRYAFCITGVERVRLNVFDENSAAKHCYEKVGFTQESKAEHVFSYRDVLWSRCHMTVTKQAWMERSVGGRNCMV